VFFAEKYRKAVWVLSLGVGILVILAPVLNGQYFPSAPYYIPTDPRVNNTLVVGLLICLLFPAIVEACNYRWRKQVDKNIPRLLRDIAEAVRSGVTLPRALEEAAQRDYGPLSKEIERAVAMFICGATWEDAMNTLARRLKQPNAKRLATILIEAHKTGGKLMRILDTSVRLFSSFDEYQEERNTKTKPYVLTIYMGTIIFLIIVYVVLNQLLAPLCLNLPQIQGNMNVVADLPSIEYFNSILFWAAIVQSLCGGLIAGKIESGSLPAGMRHSVILLSATLMFFNVLGSIGGG